jgi:ATP/maltotriose-dependent transcriptional regulator MalT
MRFVRPRGTEVGGAICIAQHRSSTLCLPFWGPAARLARARVALACDDLGSARDALEPLRHEADLAGMHARALYAIVQWRADAEGRLAATLSERDRTVLRLLAAGHTTLQIAETLFLAVGSVKSHMYNISAKLRVRTRTQSAQRAREQGLLD